jgi:hypothetical protein
MAAETFETTVNRTKFFNIGESEDPDATGPENYVYMMRNRQSAVQYEHAANDLGLRYIMLSPKEIEIVGAIVRSELAWGAGPAVASEIIELWYDDGAGGAKTVFTTLDGNTAAGSLNADRVKAFPDLPGVTAAGPPVVVPAGSSIGAELKTNGAGFTMGFVKVEIFYRLK